MGKRSRTDLQLIDFAAEEYLDVLSKQQARVWVGVFVLQWSNDRIAIALDVSTKTVRSTLGTARSKVMLKPSIAYRSIDVRKDATTKRKNRKATQS